MTILGLDQPGQAALAAALRELFSAANYTLERVAELLSPAANAALARLQPYAARRELATLTSIGTVEGGAVEGGAVERGTVERGTADAGDSSCGGVVAALTRLFLLGEALPEHLARPALSFANASTWDLAVAGGLLVPARQGKEAGADAQPHWEAAFSITPHAIELDGQTAASASDNTADAAADTATGSAAENAAGSAITRKWWIASDHGHLARPARAGLPPQWVGGVGGATTSLLTFMERGRVDSVLDLGTGCGIVALYATLFARHVTATDILPRALEFARFNAHLCAVSLATGPAGDGLWLAQGSLFEPVAGRRFDLIVSNPPFVITPPRYRDPAGQRLVYRDAGLGADRLVETVLRQAGQFLHPGGSLQCLLNWEQRGPAQAQAGQANPAARVAQWLVGTGLHGVLFWRETQDVCEYAEVWLRDEGLRPGPDFAFEAAYLAYLQDFAARGVQAVQLGYLFARRSPQADAGQLTWVDARHAPTPRAGAGREILYTAGGRLEFTAQDRIHLLVGARDLAQVRHYPLGAEQPAWQGLAAARGGESWETRSASALTLGALSVADQPLTVGQIANILADLLDIETAAATEQLITELNALTRQGLLLPTSAR